MRCRRHGGVIVRLAPVMALLSIAIAAPAQEPAPTTPAAIDTSGDDSVAAPGPALPSAPDAGAEATTAAVSAPATENLPVAEAAATDATPPPAAAVASTTDSTGWGPLKIGNRQVTPGTRMQLHWTAGESFAGRAVRTPYTVLRGAEPGPTLCLTAATHGDEVNGVEIVRRLVADIAPEDLAGTVIGVPIVNLLGFASASRYLPDRRDLNRYFPGDPGGSNASRIAHTFFSEVIVHCNYLVDFHTGSFKRTNLPQLRANLSNAAVRSFVQRFGATLALHKVGAAGTLRGAAVAAGIPAVAFELGEPGTLQLEHVRFGVKAIDTLLDKLDMVERFRLWSEPQPVYYQSSWMRAHQGGILTSSVQPGAIIRLGDTLGRIINPLTSDEIVIISPHDGRILGRALNQFVLPGFAIFHIGIEAPTVRDAEAPLFEDGANPPDAMPDSDGESPDEPEGGDDVPGGLSDDELH